MRALQKLVKNGNSTQVTIPRAVLHYLDWLPGEFIILEVCADKTLRIRPPVETDVAPRRFHPVLVQTAEEVNT